MAINYNHTENYTPLLRYEFIGGVVDALDWIFGKVSGAPSQGEMSLLNYNLQADMNAYNKQWNQQTFDEDVRRYEEMKRREDTALRRQAQDAKNAGLNVASIAGGGGAQASPSTPSQANMLEAPQYQAPQYTPFDIMGIMRSVAEIENIKADTQGKKANAEGKGIENDILRDSKEWKVFENEQNAKKLYYTNVGQELANRFAAIMENQNITKAQLENDILELEKVIKNNDKDLSERQRKQRETLGILETDSPEIQASKLRKCFEMLDAFEGDDKAFIKAYAKEYNAQNTRSLLKMLAQIIGGKTGAMVNDLGSMSGAFEDDGTWSYNLW